MWLVLAAAWNLSISAEEGKNKKKNQTSEYFEGKSIRDAAEVISIVASPLPSPPLPRPLLLSAVFVIAVKSFSGLSN